MSSHKNTLSEQWFDKSVDVISDYFPPGLTQDFWFDAVQGPLMKLKKDKDVTLVLRKVSDVLYGNESDSEKKKQIIKALRTLRPKLLSSQPQDYHILFDKNVLRMLPDLNMSKEDAVNFLRKLPESVRSDLCSVSTTMKLFCGKSDFDKTPTPSTTKWVRRSPSLSRRN